MVLLRTWRRDEDGTYIVLYQSTKHRDVRESAHGRGWFKPVRVQVPCGGGKFFIKKEKNVFGRWWWCAGGRGCPSAVEPTVWEGCRAAGAGLLWRA